MTTPLVSICCLTYNHEPYIRECLDGFMMQKTDFPIEILIHDDASSDNTATIIREYEEKYPEIIKPIYQKENQYSKGIAVTQIYQFPRAKGKYIAMCEGDDYWTDPHKLQKQVDFMEKHTEYSLSCHRYKIYEEDTKTWEYDYGKNLFDKDSEGIVVDNEINFNEAWLTKTMTVLIRKDMLDLASLKRYKIHRDVHLFYHLLKTGKGYCMNYFAAVYRCHRGGIHSMVPKETKIIMDFNVFGELLSYNSDDLLLRSIYQKKENAYFNYLWNSFNQRKYSVDLFKKTASFLRTEYQQFGLKKVLIYTVKIVSSMIKGFLNIK